MKFLILKVISVIIEYLWGFALNYLLNKKFESVIIHVIQTRLITELPKLYELLKQHVRENPQISVDDLLKFCVDLAKQAGIDLFKFASPEVYKELLKRLM